MTLYEIGRSSSTPQGLVVSLGVPAPVIRTVSWPGSPKAQGALCLTGVGYRNEGGDGDTFIRIVDSVGIVLVSRTISMAAGETGSLTLGFNMPASDIIIYAQAGVGTEVTDQRGPHTIEVQLTIATSLTLTLNPTTVNPGETVSFSGQLTRADAEPPGVRTITVIDDVSGTVKATVSTDSDGNYSGSFTAPTTAGTYYYASEFGGAALAMYALAPSSSSSKSIAVGMNYALSIAAAFAAGITLLVASQFSP